MTVFDSVRLLLSQGDTAQALRFLITHLEAEKSNPEALHLLRVVEANFNSARKKELKGILNFTEAQQAYSKTTDALLSITEDLMAGRKPSLALEKDETKQNRVFWLIGAGVLLLLGLIAAILLTNRNAAPEKVAECPKFGTSGFPIMVIPFQNLGERAAQPELAIQARIRDLTTRNSMLSDVQIFSGNRFEKNTPGMAEATEVGKQCDAKMVIWGQYEKIETGISLDVRYLFTHEPNIPAGAISETLRNLSELRGDSTKFNSLEQAVFSLCTVLAVHEGRMDLAEKWVNRLENPSQRDQRIKEIVKKN